MGNSTLKLSKSNFISFSLQKKDFFISEPITGEVTLSNISNLNISNISNIKISLYIYEGWIASKNDRKHSVDSDSDRHDIFDRETKINKIEEIILDINKNQNINSRIINLPFMINTNNFSFPSFEYPKFQIRGFIRYILRGEIVQLNSNINNLEMTDEMIQIKTLPFILNSPLTSSTSTHIEKWGLMNKGTINMTCSIKKNTFFIKEIIPIDINIDNSNGKMDVNEIKVTIHRLVNFSPYIHKAKFNFDKTINKKKFKVLINKGEINDLHCNIDLYDHDISLTSISGEYEPLNNKVDINEYLPTCISSLIKCEYNIKISLYFDSYATKKSRPRCVIPISVGHFKENMENYQNNQFNTNQNKSSYSNQNTNIYSNQNLNSYPNQNQNIYPIQNINNSINQNQYITNQNNNIYSNQNLNSYPNQNNNIYTNQNEITNQNNNIYPNQNEITNQNNNIYHNQNEITNQNNNIYPNQSQINQSNFIYPTESQINQYNNIYPNQNEITPNNKTNINKSNTYIYPNQNNNFYMKQNTNIYPNQNINNNQNNNNYMNNQNLNPQMNINQNEEINPTPNIENPNYNIENNYPNPNFNINSNSNIENINNDNSQINSYPQMIEFPKVEKPNLNENQNYPSYQFNQSIGNIGNSNISAAPIINSNKK